MRILYVSHSHPPKGAILENVGGMQRVSQQLVEELERMESVDVIKETINVAGQGVALKTTSFLLEKLFELPYKAKESQADIILFSSMVTASLAVFIRKKVSVPMVTINHGRDVTLPVGIYQWFVPKVLASLDGVISVSEATRKQCLNRGMKPDQGVALPNGFDVQNLSSFPEKEQSRQHLQEKFKIPLDDHFMLLTVGRKVRRKGHEWFIKEVLPKLGPQVVYVTIGDGPEYETIQQAAEASTCYNQIFLLGRQPDQILKEAYAAADLFIMPNVPVEGDMEGFGIVLLEANMARTPAVAADLEGIKDVITQGENGYRVPALHAEQFATTVKNMLNDNLNQFADQSRDFVQHQFSWNKVAGQYVDYLQSVINQY